MIKKIFILMIGIFLLSVVSALGVSPARTTLDFEPGLTQTINYEVVNSEGKDVNLVIAAKGELASYISVPNAMVKVLAGEGKKSLSYDINLPNDLSPGLHEVEIFILEIPGGDGEGETRVVAMLEVVTQLHVYVPYPGKYANAQMQIVNSKDGGVTFVFPVISAGEFDLTSVKANVDIYNIGGERVDSFTTSPVAIPSGEKKEIVRNWGVGSPPGEYLAVASLIYDEGTHNFNSSFSMGGQELLLQDISVNKFSLGGIVKLDMLVENRWSEEVKDASIDAKILNDRGQAVSEFESAMHDVPARGKENFVVYWDTAGVKVGEYDANIAIKYAGKSSESNLRFRVDENELTVFGLGYVISAEGEGDANTLVVVLVVVIVLLVLINLLWFLLLRKRLKK